MAYLDSKHIAFFSTGRLPVLAPGTDPSLPTFGTGPYDWKGFLSLEQHPHEVDPAGETLLNWNNKPAPEWGAASDNFSYGPVYRVQMFKGFKAGMDEADDASIMNRAATQDFRALTDWPLIARVLATQHAPRQARRRSRRGGHQLVAGRRQPARDLEARRARGGGAQRRSSRRSPKRSSARCSALCFPNSRRSTAPTTPRLHEARHSTPAGTATSTRTCVRCSVKRCSSPYSRGYCGNGSLDACSASLWNAIQAGVEALAAEQGPNPALWRAPKVRITFPPGLLPYSMRWTNRSTFQQVIEFTGSSEH